MSNAFSRPLLDPRHFRMDDLLRRPYNVLTPLGCAGETLWAEAPQGWGFRSGVHLGNRKSPEGTGPFTLTIAVDGEAIEPGDALYRPSHVTLNGRHDESGLQVTEDKFISDDDVIVSVLSFRNPGDQTVSVELDYSWGIASGAVEILGKPVWIRREPPPGDDLVQSLPSGARRMLVFAVAVAPSREEALYRAAYWRDRENAVYAQATAYQNWFDENAPRFDCSDPWLTKLWYHRWASLRRLRGETDEEEEAVRALADPSRGGAFQAAAAYARAQFEQGDFSLPREAKANTASRHLSRPEPALCRFIEESLLGLSVTGEDDDASLTVSPRVPPPQKGGWSHFCLENYLCRGRLLTMVWDDPADPSFDAYQDGDMGLTLYSDGRRFYHQDDLNPFSVALPF
ncbi:MAG: hypothetical protein V4671_08555 [Armatimonadota bacterium]